jgi:hypothetical protein
VAPGISSDAVKGSLKGYRGHRRSWINAIVGREL